MKHYQFTEDEYIKLSNVTGVSLMDLQKLDSLGLLVNKLAVRMVFDYEYRLQRKITKALPKLIIRAIANKYGLDVREVKQYLFARANPVFYCCRCNKEITKLENKRNGGLCDQCVINDIKL